VEGVLIGDHVQFDLVAMPWMRPEFPSMAISRLRSVLTASGHHGNDHYVNIRWLEMLVSEYGLEGSRVYTALVDEGARLDVGSWIFSRAYWGIGVDDAVYLDAVRQATTLPIGILPDFVASVPDFCRGEAERILAAQPDIIGFTTTFQQTYPSLTLARHLKALAPNTPIVFGGANCDGDMGAGLLDAFPEVDFALSGEAEHSIIMLADHIRTGTPDRSDIVGLSWRENGVVRTSAAAGATIDLDALPEPDHSAFFVQFESSGLVPVMAQPGVSVETSRGCWWGQKKHCTFCGINGATIEYRSETGHRAVDQIVAATSRHRTPNVVVVDNILDRTYFDDALPALAALDVDLSIFYEIRSDMSADEIRALAAAGVRFVQPGIESLGTGPLRLMRKSSTGAKQVQVLRDLHTEGITAAWNYLYGFPGEDWERDYAPIVDQLPNLVHLTAPDTSRIILQRFSPNFNDPSFGFRPIGPPPMADHLHPGLSLEQVMRIAYQFTTPDQGCTDAMARPLRDAIKQWQKMYRTSSLRWRPTIDGAMIQDRRSNRSPVDHLLDPIESALYAILRVPLSPPAMSGALARLGFDADRSLVDGILSDWRRHGLVFTDGANWVALANEARQPLLPAQRAQRRKMVVTAS
jgi:ribosomal peptide maturation radical SAM protein 1